MKYKICVYAICKNEENFVDRWYKSMSEADEIYVLDTGSTDRTCEKLIKYGVNVRKEIIKPWRFDVARNKSLEMVPSDTDICVCTDLDEVFVSGWREKLEKFWQNDTTLANYNYNWSLDENNKPLVNFYIEKIHSRHSYQWIHPVHEVLEFVGKNENRILIPGITLNHYPDINKSRSNYLPLLELSVKEKPNNDRNMHYLGREYMYYKKYNKAIDTLIKHLNLPKATWKDERCASMRFIARSYIALGRYDEAYMWLNKAIKEAPYLRDPYIEKALVDYRFKNNKEIIKTVKKALKIKEHQKTYINEYFSWNYTPYDLLSLAYFDLKEYRKSLYYVKKALKFDPNNERLLQNKDIISKYVEKYS